ncbi:dolichol-phosphate mannosyltransferase subunit 3 [Aspergillus fumigatus]
MTRAQQTLSILLLVSSLYLVLYLGLVPLNETVQNEIIPVFAHQLPFYGLICFACYLGGRLGLAILTFNDCPEAHKELQKEIEQAKADLRSKNVDVD